MKHLARAAALAAVLLAPTAALSAQRELPYTYQGTVHAVKARYLVGADGAWSSVRTAIGQDFDGRTALVSPFDRLVHDRVRAQDLFEFEYYLEMYKPAPKRRWGYFALPVLYDDRLVGKVDAGADRKASTLRVHAIHEDVRFTRAMTKAVHAELEDLASWLGLGAVQLEGA